jgi:hypothetical protein
MWIYFLERENEKVVIPSNCLLLDMTRETQEALEKFNIRYTLAYPYIEDFEYAERIWKKGGYEIAGIEWLVGAVAGWRCEMEDRTEQQPLLKYEDVFNKHPKTTRERKEEVENKTPSKPTKPPPFQRWTWSKKNFAEGAVETIIEEVLRRGLVVEFLTSRLGRELMNYYGEALRDLVREKIRDLTKAWDKLRISTSLRG